MSQLLNEPLGYDTSRKTWRNNQQIIVSSTSAHRHQHGESIPSPPSNTWPTVSSTQKLKGKTPARGLTGF
ncbi:hypothetical protein FB639_004487, partial [Coemansia asiatica]